MAEHHPHHHHDQSSGAALRGAAALTVAFAVVAAPGGRWTGSLALLSDAGHMLTDGAALALGALAALGAPLLWPRACRDLRRSAERRSHACDRGRPGLCIRSSFQAAWRSE